jgi:hypothetical protein
MLGHVHNDWLLSCCSGPPDPPSNCSVVNQTTDSLEVSCVAGFDGGLAQRFRLEVADLATGKTLANTTHNNTYFQVNSAPTSQGHAKTFAALHLGHAAVSLSKKKISAFAGGKPILSNERGLSLISPLFTAVGLRTELRARAAHEHRGREQRRPQRRLRPRGIHAQSGRVTAR